MAAPKPESTVAGDQASDQAASDRASDHTPSDDQLCDALVEGQRWAADALYDRIEGTVDTVLYRVVGGGDAEREDLMQAALEKVIRTVISGRFGRRCSLKSWATLVTQHVAFDALRARARERTVLDRRASDTTVELVAARGSTPEGAAETRQRFAAVRAALAHTKRERAETVILHDLLGHELTEIARMTGVSVAAAQSRLVRGRRDVADRILAAETGGKARTS